MVVFVRCYLLHGSEGDEVRDGEGEERIRSGDPDGLGLPEAQDVRSPFCSRSQLTVIAKGVSLGMFGSWGHVPRVCLSTPNTALGVLNKSLPHIYQQFI